MTLRHSLSVGLFLLLAVPALPQETRPQDPVVPPGVVQPPEPELTPEQERIQKLLLIQFDRRQSSILKAIAEEEAKPDTEPDGQKEPSIDEELERLQRDVTLGAWPRVEAYLAGLPEEDGKKAHAHLLTSLLNTPPPKPTLPQPGMPAPRPPPSNLAEKNVLIPFDILGLADASPQPLERDAVKSLGVLLKQALSQGYVLDAFLVRLKTGTKRLGGEAPAMRKATALLLISADRAPDAGAFLPSPEQAETEKDREALNLLARYYTALHAKEEKTEYLEQAWNVTQVVLSLKETTSEEKEEALVRALDLAPQINEALGRTWLEESFTLQPARGIEILATIGSIASKNRHQLDAQFRLKKLELQSQAIEALLDVAAERAESWRRTLTLLALNWLREAELSHKTDRSVSRNPLMRIDPYGNIYYAGRFPGRASGGNQPRPIPTGSLLDQLPSDAWLERIDASLQPRFKIILARLFLKVNEEEKAFPYIEALSQRRPETALELADEFIEVWTSNHDPNRARNRTNPYMYIYGYNPRAASIPLTRSKQERNLEDLAGWVERLRALPIGELDERLLAKAFTTSHSIAEVYRLETIENVFGSADTLKPKTLAELVQTMRRNLAVVWRRPQTQQQNKTRRKDKEIEAEVLRGYQVASDVLKNGLGKYPDHWSLHLARAAIRFDEISYRHELLESPDFTTKRDATFALFRKAAELYAQEIPEMAESDETAEVYETWFYAGLGASDLAGLKHEHQPDLRQPALIRRAIFDLPGEAAERHMARFANSLSTRMTSVKAELKHRYLKAGLRIAGDHKQAREAGKLFQYYGDLVTEIKLNTHIDGSDVVGHTRPFGLFVEIRHTKEIERESGGFAKYLQNQLTNTPFFNYGRPPENYREKFEDAAREALRDSFDVLSVTFHTDDIESRGDPEEGWRITPYAYLLLKARGPQVDEIPSLSLDLDFMDTSGYCVLPIESPRVPIDASPDAAGSRPMERLEIVQTLDERQAEEGFLILEIKATARGLVPPLEEIIEVKPESFEIVKVDDPGVAVVEMDAESERNAAVSERNWIIKLKARGNGDRPADTFQFGRSKVAESEVTYQRYEDADLVQVEREISLSGSYGTAGSTWFWVIGIICVVGVGGVFFLYTRARPAKPAALGRTYELPADLTPFTVLNLLRAIRQDDRVSPEHRGQIDQVMGLVEQHFFNRGTGDPPDLQQIAERWIRSVSPGAES